MNIVGISGLHQAVPFKRRTWPHLSEREYRIAQGFDSAAALLTGEGIRAAAAEERFNRRKATGAFPSQAMRWCMEHEGLSADQIDYVAHNFEYEPLRALRSTDPLTAQEFDEVYSAEAQLRCLRLEFPGVSWEQKLVSVPHHLAHAASAFYVCGSNEALILVLDGMGEQDSTTVAFGSGDIITTLKQVKAVHSLGILYGVFTLYLGFFMNLDEYKVMGLAPYGNPRRYLDKVLGMVHLQPDGGYTIPILFENSTREQQETYAGTLAHLATLLGPPRQPEEEITQRHMDVAAALQAVLQLALLHIIRHFKQLTGQRTLCLAGGVALNCTANGVILRSRLFDRVFVQPAAGDDGSALGAALWVQRQRDPGGRRESMTVPLWGPAYDSEQIAAAVQLHPGLEVVPVAGFVGLVREVACRLAAGQIVGWFQGRMEFGPRALGNRSILASPLDATIRTRLNRLVKQREEFRPFAPAVAAEGAAAFFEIAAGQEATYAHMLFVTQVRSPYRAQLPAITHVDGSARVQTVTAQDNWRFWRLLHEFEQVAGVPILVNTSFNVRGQPIVCTPDEAIDTFIAAGLDALVIGDYLLIHSGPDTTPVRNTE